jgi:hypothetical protein
MSFPVLSPTFIIAEKVLKGRVMVFFWITCQDPKHIQDRPLPESCKKSAKKR